ncbi:MAG TPA: PEP-CTERM sorting domain-containing protein, partial [Thermoguttaceae bacterium]|nr:PEP-CTERM sorting domain-containing protein [Thermoguttaceae bacterium]
NAGELTLGDGVLSYPGGPVTIADGLTLNVSGHVNRRVVGDSSTTLVADGNTMIGNLGAGGYAYQGNLDVGSHSVALLNADPVDLYGAQLAGGTLSSANGIRLRPLSPFLPTPQDHKPTLFGNGTVDGNVDLNNGFVRGDGDLVFTGIVGGGGTILGADLRDATLWPAHTLGSADQAGQVLYLDSLAGLVKLTIDGQLADPAAQRDYDQIVSFGMPLNLGGTHLEVIVASDCEPSAETDVFEFLGDARSLGINGFYTGWFDDVSYSGEDPMVFGYDWEFDGKDKSAGEFRSAWLTVGDSQPPSLGTFRVMGMPVKTVPEPGTSALLGVGLAAFLLWLRRRLS